MINHCTHTADSAKPLPEPMLTNEVLLHLRAILQEMFQKSILNMNFELHWFQIIVASPRGQWVNPYYSIADPVAQMARVKMSGWPILYWWPWQWHMVAITNRLDCFRPKAQFSVVHVLWGILYFVLTPSYSSWPSDTIDLGQHRLNNVLLPDSTKPLSEPKLTSHQHGLVVFTWGQFQGNCIISRYLPLIWIWRITGLILLLSQGPLSQYKERESHFYHV